MRPATTTAALSLVAAVLTLTGERMALPAHDLAGRLRPRVVPAVLLAAEGDFEAARRAAEQAGAAAVLTALPEGHADLGGAAPAPGTLQAGVDGRIRYASGRRLPLPEALDGLVRLRRSQLGDKPPPALLSGKQVVLYADDVWADEHVAAPGHATPVPRAALVAVAAGVEASGVALRPLPLLLAGICTALVTASWALFVRRRMPRAASIGTGVGLAGLALVAIAARVVGLDLPFLGMAFGMTAALGLRAGHAVFTALTALDRVTVRLGAPPDDDTVPSALDHLAEMAALYAPDHVVQLWRREPGQTPVLASTASTGDAPAQGIDPPTLTRLPAVPESGETWHVEPVRAAGEVTAALVLAGSGPVPPDLVELARGLARTHDRASALRTRPLDPVEARASLAALAVRRALDRVDQWDALLGDAQAPLGLFDVAGGQISAGTRMRTLVPEGHPVPLLGLVEQHARLTPKAARLVLQHAAAHGARVPVPDRQPAAELQLQPLRKGDAHLGFLVYEVEHGAPAVLDQVKVAVASILGHHARAALGEIEDELDRLAAEANDQARAALAAELKLAAARAAGLLERAEALVATAADTDAPHAMAPAALVAEAIGLLPTGLQTRIAVQVPTDAPDVLARQEAVVLALTALLDAATRRGEVALHGRDAAGAYDLVLGAQAPGAEDETTRAAVVLARSALQRSGGELESQVHDDGTLHHTVRLPRT